MRADLAVLFKALPYSVKPMEAWARPEGYWLTTSPARPDSPGWTEEQQVAKLRNRERDREHREARGELGRVALEAFVTAAADVITITGQPRHRSPELRADSEE